MNLPIRFQPLLHTGFLLFSISGFLLSCNQETRPPVGREDSISKKETLVYPFPAKYSLNWQAGDEKNAVLVLTCLKKYVEGDIPGCMAYFADTAEFIADKFRFKGSRDSLAIIIAAMRGASVTVSKEFETWLTAYYPDKNETWVTLWYTEKMTDKKGKIDSIYYTDDVLIKNDKIVEYDEKQRLFPAPGSK